MSEVVQYIIVRKDLNMTHGKMAAQVAHASMASVLPHLNDEYVNIWVNGIFTKIVLEAKNRDQLEKLMLKLQDAGIVHVHIVDSCKTELAKETEKGTLTCVGIKPYPRSMVHDVVRKYQLYK